VHASSRGKVRALTVLQRELAACTACTKMIGPVVHGPPVPSSILLIGQAPGPREGSFGRPFAWTAGRTLFKWFEDAFGATEEEVRAGVYFAAVARCFPGKAKGGGDRRPDPEEIERCRTFLEREVAILRPRLVLPVGTLAIREVMGHEGPLAEVVGDVRRVRYHGASVDVIALPHPSGASTWHRMGPGKTLLTRALRLLARHPETARVFGPERRTSRGRVPTEERPRRARRDEARE
jgi:uracil-DNA glycosylase